MPNDGGDESRLRSSGNDEQPAGISSFQAPPVGPVSFFVAQDLPPVFEATPSVASWPIVEDDEDHSDRERFEETG